VQVGAGVHLKRCIVDKNVQIPAGERIGFDSENDLARFVVSKSGITAVPKDYCF
jgi:glucose-1-phosphate adenylyltransferase